jgi:hypothetical protein
VNQSSNFFLATDERVEQPSTRFVGDVGAKPLQGAEFLLVALLLLAAAAASPASAVASGAIIAICASSFSAALFAAGASLDPTKDAAPCARGLK